MLHVLAKVMQLVGGRVYFQVAFQCLLHLASYHIIPLLDMIKYKNIPTLK